MKAHYRSLFWWGLSLSRSLCCYSRGEACWRLTSGEFLPLSWACLNDKLCMFLVCAFSFPYFLLHDSSSSRLLLTVGLLSLSFFTELCLFHSLLPCIALAFWAPKNILINETRLPPLYHVADIKWAILFLCPPNAFPLQTFPPRILIQRQLQF